MELSTFAAFWAVSILFVITPGADWAYAITAGLRHRTLTPAISGLLAGHVLATAVVAAGVAAVLAGSPTVLTVMTVAGAAYLVWLGVQMVRADASVHEATTSAGGGRFSQAVRGLGVSGMNPKVFLLFLALLPQFVRPEEPWPVPTQIFALGMVHVASCAVVYTLVAVGAKRILAARPAAARVVTRVSGGAMVVIGGVLIAEQVLRWGR